MIELFDKYFKKSMTSEEIGRLKEILDTEEGRRSFVRYADETGQIIRSVKQMNQIVIEDEALSELVLKSQQNLMNRINEVHHDDIEATAKPPARPRHFLFYFTLAAAAGLVFFLFGPKTNTRTVTTEETAVTESQLIKSVARVTYLYGKANAEQGDWLKPGRISLEEGEMEITFDSGAVVLLQGNSSIKLESPMRAFLEKGKVAARVSEEAKGFIINTPRGSVVDLGTEFALSVSDDKAMEVHVLEGEVEADSYEGNNPKLLKKDEALRINQAGDISGETQSQADQFVRVNNEIKPLNYNYIYWPFEEKVNGLVLDEGNMGYGGRFDLNLEKGGTISKGKYGRALSLSGRKKYATSRFPGIGGSNARTVSFWVKIPPDSKDKEAYAIVAWGALGPSEKWQVAYNPNPKNGVVGAIRTEFAQGYIIGTTDLRDGRWHHIVSMFIGGEDADIATHIKHYVDGELEGVSGYVPRKVSTRISGPGTQPVYIGKYINHNRWYFRGKIDEFYIFDGALTPSEIIRIRDNQSITPDL